MKVDITDFLDFQTAERDLLPTCRERAILDDFQFNKFGS